MTQKKRRFFSGSTLEAALVAAASEYGISVDEVAYREIEKRHGFLKVRRNVVIEVDPASPRRTKSTKSTESIESTVPDTPPAPPPVPAGAIEVPAQGDAPEQPIVEERPQARERPASEPKPDTDTDTGADADSEPREPQPSRGRPRRPRSETPEDEAPPRRRRSAAAEPEEDEAEHEPEEGRRRKRRRRHRVRAAGKPRDLRPIEERLPRAQGPQANAVLEGMDWLLDLVDLDVDAEVYQGDDRYEVELRGSDRKVLIGDEGKVLLALEHLLPRVLHGVCGEAHACRVDSENYQEGREEGLRVKALELAEAVRESGRPEVMEPMDPADRRIVHLALNDEPEISTRSLGSGYFKRVKIYSE